MAVNFYKNRDELVSSWKEVVDDKNKDVDWALFGYVKQTYDLEVVAKGSGLEELAEELNSCKILYAFCRVIDPNTELSKNVLINWQGEGAPMGRAGVCANHIQDISSFFKGAHITINARTEEDVEPENILNRVAKSSATKLNLKDRSETYESTGPVGSNYQRIQPKREINVAERERFWNKEQEDEKKRKSEDMRLVDEARKKAEAAEKLRELKEAKEREEVGVRKELELTKRREAEKNAENNIRSRSDSLGDDRLDDDDERQQRAEAARKARADEAKSVISGSSIKNARALFEQNSSAGQLARPKPVPIAIRENGIKKAPLVIPEVNGKKPAETKIANVAAYKIPQVAAVHIPEKVQPKEEEVISKPTQPDVVRQAAQPEVKQVETKVEVIVKPDLVVEEVEPEVVTPEQLIAIKQQDLERSVGYAMTQAIYPEPLEDIVEEDDEDAHDEPAGSHQSHQVTKTEQGLQARALYDYQAADETEITFDPDDVITHIEQIDEGWWQGMGPDGTYGLFPANYVELIDG